jgi:hypothetical protein
MLINREAMTTGREIWPAVAMAFLFILLCPKQDFPNDCSDLLFVHCFNRTAGWVVIKAGEEALYHSKGFTARLYGSPKLNFAAGLKNCPAVEKNCRWIFRGMRCGGEIYPIRAKWNFRLTNFGDNLK